MSDGDREVVLGRAGVRTGYALMVFGLALTPLLVAAGSVVAVYSFGLAAATAWQLFARGGEQVALTSDGLVVSGGGRVRARYAWADVLEVSWRRHGSFWVGPGPVLRVTGGPFDEPGPNMPAQVASLPVFGHRAGAAAEASLRSAVQARGIRFDPDMERDIATGRRRPQDPERGSGTSRPARP